MRIVNIVGRNGENSAVKYLQGKGYAILERNFRKQYAEIDIIALSQSKDVLVFIEVKTRSSNTFGTPFEAITHFKLKSLIKAAQYYALSHPKLPQSLRIDAIAVDISDNKETIEHIENITF